jgi:hypothetical protein
MKNTQEAINMAAQNAALADLNLDGLIEEADDDFELADLEGLEEIIDEDPTEDDEVDMEVSAEDAELIEGEIVKAELYENSAVKPSDIDTSGKKPKKAKTPKSEKAKIEKRTPRVSVEELPAEIFVLKSGETASEENKTAVLATRPGQKKIAEKFDNLFSNLNTDKLPSTYVVKCFKFLDAQKTVTSAEMINMLCADYGVGTARSQVGQIMKLFDTVGIATRGKNVLTIKEDSMVAERLRGLINPVTAS